MYHQGRKTVLRSLDTKLLASFCLSFPPLRLPFNPALAIIRSLILTPSPPILPLPQLVMEGTSTPLKNNPPNTSMVSAQQQEPSTSETSHDAPPKWSHYKHADMCACRRWTTRECHQYLESRLWAPVLSFYSLVARGELSLQDLIFSEQVQHAGPLQRRFVKEEVVLHVSSRRSLDEAKGGKWGRKTYKIVISYDGSAFVGWQKQPGLSTIQGLIEEALGQFVDGKRAKSFEAQGLPVEATVSVAGRTDKGVHAAGQVCSFYTWRTDIKIEDVKTAINAVAPKALRVVDVEEVSRTFHPNFSARWRRYVYILPLHNCEVEDRLCEEEQLIASTCSPLPPNVAGDDQKNPSESNEKFEWPWESEVESLSRSFDVTAVNALLHQLEGHALSYSIFARDTETSRSKGAPTVCLIHHVRAAIANLPAVIKGGRKVMCVELVADRFLRKMVRVLVATAVREAAAGAPIDSLLQLITATCRGASAPPAPACGLCLAEVGYEDLHSAKYLLP